MNDYEVCGLKCDNHGRNGEWEWVLTIRETSRRRAIARVRKEYKFIEGTFRVRKLA